MCGIAGYGQMGWRTDFNKLCCDDTGRAAGAGKKRRACAFLLFLSIGGGSRGFVAAAVKFAARNDGSRYADEEQYGYKYFHPCKDKAVGYVLSKTNGWKIQVFILPARPITPAFRLYCVIFAGFMSAQPLYDEPVLLNRVSKGDVLAFRELFDHHRNKVFFIARQMLHSESAAEDAVQEIFLKLWLHNTKLAEVSNFTAYLNTVTRNHIYNTLRKKAGEEKLLHTLLEQELQTPGSPETMNTVAFHELQELLKNAMQVLSPQQKKVFEKSRLEGLKQEQIAQEMGLSRETVKKYLADALDTLRRLLGVHGKGLLLVVLLLDVSVL